VSDEISDDGIAVMGVDILPTELRRVCVLVLRQELLYPCSLMLFLQC
jgi:hypothetical protein